MNGLLYRRLFQKSCRGELMNISIKSFYIDGYRNISNFTLNMQDVTAIIALNNYGKSNLINAIRMGVDFIKGSNDIKASIFEYMPAYPFLSVSSGKNFTFGVVMQMIDEISNTVYKIDYRYSFKWRTKSSEGAIDEECLRITAKGIAGGNVIVRNKDASVCSFRASLKTRNKRRLIIKDNSLAINALINIVDDDETFLKILNELNNIKFSIEDHLDANESYDFDPIQYRGAKSINVPRLIWDMKEKHPDEYEMLIDSFKQLFPNIVEIHCQEHPINHSDKSISNIDPNILFNDSIYTLSVKDPSFTRPISFNYLSDGTKRVFLTLVTAVTASINQLSVLALEEPENSIHPKLLQSYISILDTLSGDCKLIFTSHSPYIIQCIDPQSIIIGLPSKSGQADFRYISKPLKIVEDAYIDGCSLGDFIFGCLSFENAADILEEYLSDSQTVSNDEVNEDEKND